MIARYVPALGDPWRLSLARWNAVLDRVSEIIERENPGDPEDPKTLQRHMDLMKRQKRRQEAWESHGRYRR